MPAIDDNINTLYANQRLADDNYNILPNLS